MKLISLGHPELKQMVQCLELAYRQGLHAASGLAQRDHEPAAEFLERVKNKLGAEAWGEVAWEAVLARPGDVTLSGREDVGLVWSVG